MTPSLNAPWRYDPGTGHVLGADGKVIAFIARSAVEANPRLPELICAAPDLLAVVSKKAAQ